MICLKEVSCKFSNTINQLNKMYFLLFIESVWIPSIIYFCLLLIIFVVIKFFGGPRNFIDYCQEIINGDTKKHTWVFLVAGSKGFDNYRHQVYKYLYKKKNVKYLNCDIRIKNLTIVLVFRLILHMHTKHY